MLILNNAGVDLEHCTLASLVQAKSILLQTCLSLAAVERVRDRKVFGTLGAGTHSDTSARCVLPELGAGARNTGLSIATCTGATS